MAVMYSSAADLLASLRPESAASQQSQTILQCVCKVSHHGVARQYHSGLTAPAQPHQASVTGDVRGAFWCPGAYMYVIGQ